MPGCTIDQTKPFKFYGCNCGGPPRLTYRDGLEVAPRYLIFFTFLYLLHVEVKNTAE